MTGWHIGFPEGLRLGHLAVLGALAEGRNTRAQRELSAQLRIHPSDMVTLVTTTSPAAS